MTSSRRDDGGARRLTIGKVLDQLRPEFPDVTASKIRFLEAEGLVTPDRTGAGYRTYSTDDVGRLRYVLTAQRDRFWPLRVIREALDALDRGLTDPTPTAGLPRPPAATADPEVPSAAALRPARPVSLTAAELQQASGIEQQLLASLVTFGIVQPDGDGHFPGESVAVAAAAHRLAQHGLEPRHLRPFRAAADREIGLAEQLLAPHRGEARQALTAEIVSACLALHAALVRAGLAGRG